jgi:hypothetical protein
MKRSSLVLLASLLAPGGTTFLLAAQSETGRLHAGWAARDITPDRPVALCGQFHKRISTRVEAPLWATALALEARDGDRVVDQAVLVSCDLVGIAPEIPPRLRRSLEGKVEGFDLRKIVLNATHTHTGPVTGEQWYEVTEEGVMKPGEYMDFLVGRLAEAVAEAWQKRKPGGVNWGLGYATVGFNRRMAYADGRAAMYGANNGPDFRNVEGYQDSAVETLFFWDEEKRLTGMAVNVPCPSQVVENANYISSDYWHDVRAVLRERYSKDLQVLAWCSAAGDLSPHPQIRRAADERMRKLRGNLSETRAIALRIADAVDYAYSAVRDEIRTEVPFAHRVEDLVLPARKVIEKEYLSAKSIRDRIAAKPREKWGPDEYARHRWHQEVVDRYEKPEEHATLPMELHALRLGDVAIATNPFELFLDYGIQMKTRSRAIQTFVVQLAAGRGGYLPTEKAVAGGGYSAVPESGLVGPEGGRILVERTLEAVNGFWGKKAK